MTLIRKFQLAVLSGLLCGVGLAAPAVAQMPAKVPDASGVITRAHLDAAKKLLASMGSVKRFDEAIELMAKRLAERLKKQAPQAGEAIDKVFAEIARKYRTRSQDALSLIAPLYAQKFSTVELEEVIRFYQSPVGRKFIANQPEISQRSDSLGLDWGKRIAWQMQRDALDAFTKEGVEVGPAGKPK